MHTRLLTGAGTFAVATAALAATAAMVWTASGTLAAQSAAAPRATQTAPATPAARPAPAPPAMKSTANAKAYVPPRLADGHPDLQGTYDVATITPLERPAAANGRLVLTDEEVSAMEAYEKERVAKGAEPSDPNRTLPPVGGDTSPTKSYLEGLFRAGGGTVGGYNNFWIAAGERNVKVDGQNRSSIVVDPADGRVPRTRPEAIRRNAALNAARVNPDANEAQSAQGPAGAFDNPEARPLAERCLLGFGNTSGPPTLPNYFYNNLKQIVQTPTTVMILNEMVHDARIIRIGGQHLPSNVRNWMGDSIGHWEGDTLVVDTTNFTDKTQFRGSSENLHVVERFTRTDADTILYRFTVEDPTTWDRAWTGEYPWVKSAEQLYEYACHEGNYSLKGVLNGQRVREKDKP